MMYLLLLSIIGLLWFCGTLLGLYLMSEHFHYPKVTIKEWDIICWIPFAIYYYLIFTNKLEYEE